MLPFIHNCSINDFQKMFYVLVCLGNLIFRFVLALGACCACLDPLFPYSCNSHLHEFVMQVFNKKNMICSFYALWFLFLLCFCVFLFYSFCSVWVVCMANFATEAGIDGTAP